MIMKMAIQMVLGSVFGAMGSMMSTAMTMPKNSSGKDISKAGIGCQNGKNPDGSCI